MRIHNTHSPASECARNYLFAFRSSIFWSRTSQRIQFNPRDKERQDISSDHVSHSLTFCLAFRDVAWLCDKSICSKGC